MAEIRKVYVDEPQFPQLPLGLSPRKVVVNDTVSPFVPKDEGGLVDLSPILEDYEDSLTKEDIIADPRLMEVVRSSLESRFTPGGVLTKARRGATGLAGGAIGGLTAQDYREMDDEKVFEIWQNYQRSFSAGQSVTVANEMVYGMKANDEVKARLGAGYALFDQMDNAFTGEGSWREMGDAIFDYTKSVVYDPTTILSLGLGKLFTMGATKASSAAVKAMMGEAYKQQIKKGVAKKTAAANIRTAAVKAIPYATADALMASGVDVMYQAQLMETAVQDEYSKAQTGITALGTLFLMPTLAATGATFKEIRKGPLKNTFLSYKNFDAKILEVGVDQAEKELREQVAEGIDVEFLDETFGLVKGNTKNFFGWDDLKDEAGGIIRAKGQKYTDTEVTNAFFKHLFMGDPDANVGGYGEVLRKAGFTNHQALIDKYGNKTAVLAQTLGFISDEKVGQLVKKFEKDTGYKLRFINEEGKVTQGKDAKSADLVAHLTRQTSLGGQSLQLIQSIEKSVGVIENIGIKTKPTKFEVGKRVIAKDKGNIGTVVSTKGNTVNVRFINKEKGTEAVVPFKKKDLTPVVKDIPTEDAIKLMKGEKPENTPKRLQFALSTYKRLLTSHLATTGANIKGFVSLVNINTAADAFTSSIELSQGIGAKLFGNPEAAEKYFNRAYGSLGGAVRRYADALSPDIPIEYADKILDLRPEIAAKLFRDVSGDGGVRDALSDFDIDPNNLIYKGVDSATKGAQTIALVRLQDELTKRWSFGTNLNQEIMRTYGMSPEKFFGQQDVALVMAKEDFKEVLDKAAYRAMRETASVNWSTLPGNSSFRSVAKGIEDFTNRSVFGFVVPFGSFLNTTIATMGDLTGVNAIAHTYRRATGKNLDYTTPTGAQDLGKMAVFYGGLVYGTQDARERIKNNLAYDQELKDDGSIELKTFDWPDSTLRLMSQILAHGLGDSNNIFDFNRKEVPSNLVRELGIQLGGQAIRDLDSVGRGIYQIQQDFLDSLERGEPLRESLAIPLGAILERPVQGLTRPLDPINQVWGLMSDGNMNPDLRQGPERLNNILKYVNNITGRADSLPERATPTRDRRDIDLGRQILGVRGISTPNLVEKMMNAAGQPYYKAIKFQGPAEIKNIMDGLAAPYFEVAAIKYLKKNPNYFDMPLKNKERVLDLMRADVRKDVTKMVQKGLPKEIDLVRVLSGKDKDKVREIMNELGLNMELEGLLQKEDGLQDLLRIKTLLDNYDDIFSDIVD